MSKHDVPWFRDLYYEILEYTGYSLGEDVLGPWVAKGFYAAEQLRCFQRYAPYDPCDSVAQAAMWNLYALGRVNDLLISALGDFSGLGRLSLDCDGYRDFFLKLGFTTMTVNRFSAFFHEVVEVQQTPAGDQPIERVAERWPCLMLGDLMFSRAGMIVASGRQHMVKPIAERSVLYFTSRRTHRSTQDLSHGWGSNSQWRTSYRRDYLGKDKLIYNADGKNLLHQAPYVGEQDGLTWDERVELCRHRCFIVTAKADDDRWPYDDRYEENRF